MEAQLMTKQDGVGLKDRVDLDSDNDGIPDIVESQTMGYVGISGSDSDNDGIDNAFDPDNGFLVVALWI